MNFRNSVSSLLILICLTGIGCSNNQKTVRYRPVISGEWKTITGNPDLGAYTTESQQPVDFGVWQAADGSWQLWSCIRHTKCGLKTRLFYRWESPSLEAQNWQPVGIAMEADTSLGETSGGLQAPHVFKHNGLYYMVYGDWNRICLASSQDGKQFTRVLNSRGEPDLFSGPYFNTRDPMVINSHGLFYCYYTGHTTEEGKIRENGQIVTKVYKSAIFCRTSADLNHWSEPIMVCAGGSVEDQDRWYGGDAECPQVVFKDGFYYLFRTHQYGKNNMNAQYASLNPLDFGVGHDYFHMGALPVAAPEVVFHNQQYYIFSLKKTLDGIRMAKLSWEPI